MRPYSRMGLVAALTMASVGVLASPAADREREPSAPPDEPREPSERVRIRKSPAPAKVHTHSREIARRLRQEARAAEKCAARGSKPVRVETGTGSIEDESRAEGLAQTSLEGPSS